MPKNNSRGGRNNNPSGRNQYSDWGVMDMVRDRPVAAAAAAAGAAAAGLFLWSKRGQISNQLSSLSDQIGEWKDNMGSDSGMSEIDDTGGLTTASSGRTRSGAGSRSASGTRATTTTRSRSAGSNRGMSETGGGNASLGAHTGGRETTSSSRGRARGIPSTT